MNKNITRGIVWASVSAAIIAGIFVTKSALCLWAFFIPVITE